MIVVVVLITVPVMGLLVAFDAWHCRARKPHSGG
jgi:heme/copper-type cytochrome/quinol oxidase subunit 2